MIETIIDIVVFVTFTIVIGVGIVGTLFTRDQFGHYDPDKYVDKETRDNM